MTIKLNKMLNQIPVSKFFIKLSIQCPMQMGCTAVPKLCRQIPSIRSGHVDGRGIRSACMCRDTMSQCEQIYLHMTEDHQQKGFRVKSVDVTHKTSFRM